MSPTSVGLPAAIVAALVCGPVTAQIFPTKPLRMIVPQAPGAQNDTQARLITERLSIALGQPVVVDNRPGAGGQIGFEIALKSPPDGHTIVLGSISTLAIIPIAYRKAPYEVSQFTPVTLVSTSPYVLVVHPSVPARSVRELVALAKKRPGALSYGSSGNATGVHLTTELFSSIAGVRMVHVPYKGAAPATTDILGGQIEVMFNNVIPSLPHVRSGRLRALAVTTGKRNAQLPEVPTVPEAGIPGFESGSWQGVVIAHAAPRAVVDRLHGEIVRILRADEVRSRIEGFGNDVVANTPDEFAAFIRTETAKWKKVIEVAGVKVE